LRVARDEQYIHLMATNLTCTLPIPDLDGSKIVTISGPRDAVLHVVAAFAGLGDRDGVTIRRNLQSDDGLPLLVVDEGQADSCPAFIAEVVSGSHSERP
jgi:hypothetical protein